MVDDDDDGDEAREHPSPWAEVFISAGIGGKPILKQLQEKYTQVITRAEFCSLAVRAYEKAKCEITGRKSFSGTNDIDVEKMAYLGVVSGANTEGTLFNPDDQLTREQAAVILSRLASAVGKPFSG
ncbi:MAG: S-layer homology domain-containing protein [Clostridiales bacterium]|nr:S-layer homology domain-containing protein [Clostridiales bacterium]